MSPGMALFLVLLFASAAFLVGYAVGYEAGKNYVFTQVEPWEGCE